MPAQTNLKRPLTWSENNAIGRQKADETIARMQRERNPLILRDSVQAIAKEAAGIQVGFFNRMGEALITSG